jgi:hypothetical protein
MRIVLFAVVGAEFPFVGLSSLQGAFPLSRLLAAGNKQMNMTNES